MATLHSVFGLRVLVNQPVPGLTCLPASPPFDIEVHLGRVPERLDTTTKSVESPWYSGPHLGLNGLPTSRVWRICHGRYYRLLYDDGTECFVNRDGTEIWVRWLEALSLEEIVPYLLGQVLGLAQRLRGIVCLHASAILLNGCAVAFMGPQGSGKSSAAAAFLRLGYPVLADDVVPVIDSSGSFYARSAHPRIWLCPDMVETLYGSCDALPKLTPAWEKSYVNMRDQPRGFENQSAPLRAIYYLTGGFDVREPVVKDLSPMSALMHLVSNTYVNHLLDRKQRASEFEFLGRLVRAVPVREVQRLPIGPERALICEAILENYHLRRKAAASEAAHSG